MKKIIVVGGGIAGLSAGVYAQKCGFDVTILESHSMAGGNCTSWKRKGYLFEGGMHWLTGSNPNDQVNKMWRHIGALDDSVKILCPEPFMEYNYQGTPIRIYRNIDTTEKHLITISPIDEKEIRKMCNNVRKVQNLAMPITDIKGVKVTKKNRPPLSLLFSAVAAIRLMNSFSRISRDAYVSRYSYEGLRNLFRACLTEKSGVVPIFFTLGTLARGDGGFPEGGSLPFVRRIVNTFSDLGGKILCNTKAEKILIENGKFCGVKTSGERLAADAVIITADTMAIDHLFDTPPQSAWLDKMKKTTEPTMNTLISLGVDADLRKYPKSAIYKLEKPFSLAKENFEYLAVNNYAHDPVYSPEGKSAITVSLPGDTYDFWKSAKAENRYSEEKQKIADTVIEALTVFIPELSGKGTIEVCDIATPLTYERYCGNWKGSWMTEMTPSMKMNAYPAFIKGISGLYFAGQRMMPPGGLPVALMTGRTAVQHLCKDTDTVFSSEE